LSWAVTCNAPEFAGALVRLAVKPDFFSAAGLGLLDEVQSFYVTSGELIPNASRSGSSRLAADGSRLPCPPETPREQLSDALYIAARNGHAPVVRFLLTKDPDLSFRAYMGATALHWAHFSGSQEVVHLLSAAGADPTVRDDSLRCTPRAFGICTSASWGIPFLVNRLLNADPTLVNFTDGSTSALHQAAAGGHLETVELLLERRADRSLTDAEGQTPFDLATSRGFKELAELLRVG
jgi:ankyrin repeat protein